MNYQNLVIYYFSGTGNAKNAALWIIKIAEKKGLKSHLINIDRFTEIEVPRLTGKTLIGFCTPTHGFNVPPIMLKFVRKFPRIKNADAFILNTRGGLKLYKLFLPGLSGVAQYLPALILRAKGFRIVGMQPLDLPSNWLILHPGLREKVVNSMYGRCHSIVNRFALKIMEGGRKYKAFLSLPFDLAIAPVAIGYYFIGRFFLAKTLVATDACNNCNICVKQCPVGAIKATNSKPFWTYNCESCMRCVNNCPQRAIETTHGFAGLIIIVVYAIIFPFLIMVIKALLKIEPEIHSFWSGQLLSISKSFIFLLILFLSYKLLHFVMKYKLVNSVIAYSSFSKYRFWRRYKAPRN
jgi:Pyruvate/2-oxoacid:ferredoxin oxidoreductase delta subunit